MSADVVYRASKWGNEFHNLTHHYALGAGAAGPGKSLVLLHEADSRIQLEHERCRLPKNHKFYHPFGSSMGWTLHLRRTYKMLDQTLARAHLTFRAMDPDVKWNSETHTFTFRSGYRVQFGHCKDPTSWEDHMSNEYDLICYDELTQFLEEQWDQINTRLRSSDPLLRGMLKIRAMSNPMMRRETGEHFVVRDPHWVRRLFVDPEPNGRKTLQKKIVRRDGTEEWRTRIYLPATLYDNPDPEFVRRYELDLLDKPQHIQQALLYGNWYVVPDSYFGEFWRQELHVCEPFKIPEDWPRFRSMDWGFKAPGCVLWFAADPDGNLFVEREMNFQLQRADEVAERIAEYEKQEKLFENGRSLITGPADTQLWEERGDLGRSKAEIFASKGVAWIQANKSMGHRTSNGRRIIERLKDHHFGTTTPGLVFFRNCKKLIKTLPAIQPMVGDLDTPQDFDDDHAFDALMYGVEYASRGRPRVQRRRGGGGWSSAGGESHGSVFGTYGS